MYVDKNPVYEDQTHRVNSSLDSGRDAFRKQPIDFSIADVSSQVNNESIIVLLNSNNDPMTGRESLYNDDVVLQRGDKP
jgi:hypothetical protein